MTDLLQNCFSRIKTNTTQPARKFLTKNAPTIKLQYRYYTKPPKVVTNLPIPLGRSLQRVTKKAEIDFLSYVFVKKIPLSRRVGRVDQWISKRCMYVTPIRLDVLLNTNQISCCRGKWYVRRFDPDTVENGHIYSFVKEEELFAYSGFTSTFSVG